MFDVSSIINNFPLLNTMNALLTENAYIINAILIENENYNINNKHFTNSNFQLRYEL